MLDQMVADAQHKKQEEEQHQVGRGQGFEQFLVVKKFQLYVYTQVNIIYQDIKTIFGCMVLLHVFFLSRSFVDQPTIQLTGTNTSSTWLWTFRHFESRP